VTAPPTPIAIAVVQSGDCFLVGRRSAGSALAGMSEFPGGKLEPGESPAQAAVRECREETGIEIEILFEYPSRIQEYDHDRVELHFFACRPLGDVSAFAEPYRWVPRDQLATLEFPQGNRTLIELLTCPGSLLGHSRKPEERDRDMGTEK